MITENIVSTADHVDPSSMAVDVEIFDPPMCCPTGLCGPTLDQSLLDVSEMILSLKKAGLRVERYQMAANPGAYTSNPDVMRLVRTQQMDALPITLVRGTLIKSGGYPDLAEIQRILDIEGATL